MQEIRPMKHYPVTKRREALLHSMTRVNLDNVLLSERSQSQKTRLCIIPLHGMSRRGPSISETESR